MPQSPIMGAHFHPPAKALLEVLPDEAKLWLEPEPSNPFDSNAIKVMVNGDAIPSKLYENAADLLSEYGHSLDDVLGQEVHLGYVARAIAAEHKVPPNWPARLLFSPKPTVWWEEPKPEDFAPPEEPS